MTVRHEERRLVTCLFIDVVGSTDLTMRLGPERLKGALDEAFAELRTLIERERGTVEKYIGDAIYALFGAPVAHEDDPERALRAAAAARAWAAARTDAEIPFAVRVGLETGEAIVDLAAAAETKQQMSVGAVVNLAARLQQRADPGQILVGPVAHDATADRASFTALGDVELRGIGTVPVWSLDTLRDRPSTARTAFVGRESDLDLLRSAHRRALSGRCVLALVSGPPGQGKTRLVEEFVAAAAPATLLTARCRPGGEVGALAPLRELLVDGGDERSLAARLEAAIPDAREREHVAAALAHSAGLRGSSALGALPPDERDDEIADAWRRWLRALCAEGPVVAWIDDVHWADRTVVRLLDRMTSGGPGPALVIATARPEFAETAGLRPSGDRFFIELEGLDPEAARSLARTAGGDDAAAERGEGNPLFIVELARHHTGRDTLPLTLQGALGARLDELDPEDRLLLAHAAVVGETFAVDDAALLDGRAAATVGRALVRLADLHYLHAIDGRYRFHHSLVRDVSYGRLLAADRMRLHARLAQERGRTLRAEVLAHHWWQALRPPDADWVWKGSTELPAMRRAAFGVHVAAGRQHAESFAVDRAVTVLERALALAYEPAQRAEAHESLGDAYGKVLRADDGWAAYRRAREAYRESGHVPPRFYLGPLRLRMSEGAFHTYPTVAEIAELQSAFDTAARATGDECLIALALTHRAFDTSEDVDVARDMALLDEAVALAERCGDAATLREVLGWQADARSLDLDVDGADAALARAEAALAEEGGTSRLDLVRGRATQAYRRGDLPELERLAGLADALSGPMGPHLRTHGLVPRGSLALAKGDWHAAVRLGAETAQLIGAAPGTKFCPAAGLILANAALAHSVTGREEEARALASRIVAGLGLGAETATLLSSYALALTSADVPDLEPDRLAQSGFQHGGALMYVGLIALARRRYGRALETADALERRSGRGARLFAALAEAVREEVAADGGGPAPRHAALRAIGYLGWSEILGRRAPAPT